MRRARSIFRRVGRLSLVGATILCLITKSTVGAALVLHQHGSFNVHLHVLGDADLLADAQDSAWFGHSHGRASYVPASPVRTIAVIGTGLIFVSENRDGGHDGVPRDNAHPISPIVVTDHHLTLAHEVLTNISSIGAAKMSTAAILLRNHALLV